jgi:hypothetical protein
LSSFQKNNLQKIKRKRKRKRKAERMSDQDEKRENEIMRVTVRNIDGRSS